MILRAYLLALLAAGCLLPAEGPATADEGPSVRPRWQVGDRWVVETATRPVQAADRAADQRTVVRWQFEVKAVEKLDGRECFRIEAAPEDGPKSVIWIDRRSLAIRQIHAGIVVGGRTKYLVESYVTASGLPTPVLSPLPALPVDLPAFPTPGTKGLDTFTYEAVPGGAGRKAVGQIGFAVSVEQAFTDAAAPEVKSLATDPFTKDLSPGAAVGVEIKGPYGRVRQLWKPGVPWPICSQNSTTTARLIEFKPAQAAGEVER